MSKKPIALRRRGVFRVPIDDFWELVSDTDRINRAAGVPPTRFQPGAEREGLPAVEARARYYGLPLRWTVLPYEWSTGRWFRVDYLFSRTPLLRRVRVGSRLWPRSPQETEVEVFADIVPSGPLGALAVHVLIGQYLMRRLMRVYHELELNYQRGAPNPYPGASRVTVDERQLELATEQLRPAPVRPALVERLVAFLRQAEDREVLGMRPFVLADQWGEDRLEVLRLCLYATRAGMLDVSWEVLCPNCRVTKAAFTSLAALQQQSHCETCNINYDVNFDEYVELRFNVNPTIREAYLLTYCVAEPIKMRHIVAQLRVAPGVEEQLALHLAPGVYRLRVPRRPGRLLLRVEPQAGSTQALVRLGAGGPQPSELELQAGECLLQLLNEDRQELLAIVEQDAWGAQGASAALVTSLQEFRQLFSSEVLSPGMSVAVRNLTVLFTDLKSSTRLYVDVGDPSAYELVRRHFDLLIDIIQQQRGALVKTIGDAVMAVFLVAEDGLRAALEMLQRIEELNAAHADYPRLCIKLGLHRGPCIAINANDMLDYFGSTVNLAARAESESRGVDVVLTQAMLDDPGVQQLVAQAALSVERFERTPKGFAESITFYRLSAATRSAAHEPAAAAESPPADVGAGSSPAAPAAGDHAAHPA